MTNFGNKPCHQISRCSFKTSVVPEILTERIRNGLSSFDDNHSVQDDIGTCELSTSLADDKVAEVDDPVDNAMCNERYTQSCSDEAGKNSFGMQDLTNIETDNEHIIYFDDSDCQWEETCQLWVKDVISHLLFVSLRGQLRLGIRCTPFNFYVVEFTCRKMRLTLVLTNAVIVVTRPCRLLVVNVCDGRSSLHTLRLKLICCYRTFDVIFSPE